MKISSHESLLQLGVGYWASKAFLTACELSLFTLIQQGHNTLESIASVLDIPIRSSRILVDGMASLGLLLKDGDKYTVSKSAAERLVEGKPMYMGNFFLAINRMFYDPFVDFKKALDTGNPIIHVDDNSKHKPMDEDSSRLFVKAMDGLNKSAAMVFGRTTNLAKKTHLLDVGGGSAIMSICALVSNPLLKATVFDRPAVCAEARKYVSDAGLTDRVSMIPGDFLKQKFPPDADVHLYSNIFQNFSSETCLTLLRKSYNSMPYGGEIIVVEYLLDRDGSSTPFVASFNLFALLAMDGGEARTYCEYQKWLLDTGFQSIESSDLSGYSTLIRGTKM